MEFTVNADTGSLIRCAVDSSVHVDSISPETLPWSLTSTINVHTLEITGIPAIGKGETMDSKTYSITAYNNNDNSANYY